MTESHSGRSGISNSSSSKLASAFEFRTLTRLLSSESSEHELRLARSDPQFDPSVFVKLCCRHGLESLVRRSVSEISDASEDSVLAELQALAARQTVQRALIVSELPKVSQGFQQSGLEAIFFKGPTLSAQIHGDPYARNYCDLDVLVRESDLAQVRTVLQRNQYERVPESQTRWEETYANRLHHVSIDVHWRMTRPELPDFSPIEAVFRDKQFVNVRGSKIPTLSYADTAIMLAMHIAKDWGGRNSYLAKLFDLHALSVRGQLDWSIVLHRAHAHGLLRTLLFGLSETKKAFGTKFPSMVEQRLHDGLPARLIHADRRARHVDLTESAAMGRTSPAHLIQQAIFGMAIIDPGEGRARKFISSVIELLISFVQPNSKDYALVRLPRTLHFAYYPMRVYRLVAGAIGRSIGSSQRRA